jgi:hypothetical protein
VLLGRGKVEQAGCAGDHVALGCGAVARAERGEWLGRGWAKEGGGAVGLVLFSLFYFLPFALLIFFSFCLDSNSSMTHKLNKCTPNKFINRNICSSM